MTVRFASALGLLALVVALASACDDATSGASATAPAHEKGSSSGNSSGSASGGGSSDATVSIDPDAGPGDHQSPLAGLCGPGVCAPGAAADGCGLEPGAGGGSAGGGMTQDCKLVAGQTRAFATCEAVGSASAEAPCEHASDCAAGLGCTVGHAGGVCEPYCCDAEEACPSKTYCAARSLVENDAIAIPVCTPADGCQLLADAATCSAKGPQPPPGCCPPGLACTIVRSDGTTTCLPPGTGGVGEPCPCQDGYVCAKLTNECKKLCHLGGDGGECPFGGTCEGGSEAYPPGIGACVGGNDPSP